MAKTSQRILFRFGAFLAALMIAYLTVCAPAAIAKETGTGESGRWGEAADEIEKYLDAGFEYYLAGDTDSAYQSVSDAYFRVYEVTGFERQTMSYISGNRKNAVEMQFSACKANVKKSDFYFTLFIVYFARFSHTL